MSNIPIYRSKKIDSDDYVEGNLVEDEGVFYIIKNPVITHFYGLQQLTGEYEYLHKIDPTTLSISFPDMLDSQGNKIFSSLQEDGKGGDIIGFSYGIPFVKVEAPVKYKNSRIDVLTKGHKPDICSLYELEEAVGEYEVIGIQE